MATLVFTAVGTALGGPLGGAIGGLVGRQVDAAIFGSPNRQGPRLDDLRISTSSYGSTIPRHFGTMRVPGSIIWATDLVEHSDTQGGGKGSPSVTSYSYTVSFAVALASRPLIRVGRIWADGNLLRGAQGDLKTSGQLRLYTGHGDHQPDPLIAAAEDVYCPAFRHTAYAVFEDLDLTNFGNRIPALSFEVIADDGLITLAQMVADASDPAAVDRPLPGLAGFSLEGGDLLNDLATIQSVYPLVCDASGGELKIRNADESLANPQVLPEPATTQEEGGFGTGDGRRRERRANDRDTPSALRYYDSGRDFLTGVQRADGRARPGRERTIEFPGALAADEARTLANGAAERSQWSRETMAWRIAELDPSLAPGNIVRAPGYAGNWLVTSWEWREHGIELELLRLPHGPARTQSADPGRAQLPQDLVAGPTELAAFELPWDGNGSGDTPRLYAATSSASRGWTGAQLFADRNGSLIPLGSSTRRAIVGETLAPLAPSMAHLLERTSTIDVRLAGSDFALFSASPEEISTGANRAMIGAEILQFARAVALGNREWRLEGLLRGRGGTEVAAKGGQATGSQFTLLDDKLTALDPAIAGNTPGTTIAALGLADSQPVTSELVNPGITSRPLAPVHAVRSAQSDGSILLTWVRRARGAWTWLDEVEVPLGEDKESYVVGLGPVDGPILRWETNSPALTIDPATAALIAQNHAGQPIWVRQVGNFALSPSTLVSTGN